MLNSKEKNKRFINEVLACETPADISLVVVRELSQCSPHDLEEWMQNSDELERYDPVQRTYISSKKDLNRSNGNHFCWSFRHSSAALLELVLIRLRANDDGLKAQLSYQLVEEKAFRDPEDDPCGVSYCGKGVLTISW